MDKIRKKQIESFLNELSSSSPTPGGGACAALSSAMAAGLCEMVTNLTIEKKGYESVQETMFKFRKRAKELKRKLLTLSDDDILAFEKVMKAYKLPRQDENRKENIQKALKYATEVPLKTAKISNEINQMADVLCRKGNKNAYSDAMSAKHISKAAYLSAMENVKINLSSINDIKWKKKINKAVEEMQK